MANTVIALRSSGVASNTPSLGVLANGELSINFADGILYYKSSSNTLGSIRTTAVSGLTKTFSVAIARSALTLAIRSTR